ncbi:MAG: segregation ATPase FtsK/SpoIIIE, family [Acidimicrobiaceae bacterium]
MRLVFVNAGHEWDLAVQVRDPSATVGHLLAALAPEHAGALLVDDRRLLPSTVPLADAGLSDGVTVSLAGDPTSNRVALDRRGSVHLDVVGGLDAGRRHALPLGPTEIGRSPDCAVSVSATTVSRRHAEVTVSPAGLVTLTDLGSRNGTWVGEDAVVGRVALGSHAVVRVGALQLSVRQHRVDDRPLDGGSVREVSAAGTTPFNRPPRPALPPEAQPVEVPAPPAPVERRSALSIASVLAPVAMAAVMVVVLHNPTFALFALLGPVMLIGSSLEQRRRGKRTSRRATARYRSELRALGVTLAGAARAELERRAVTLPDLAEVARRAQLPSVRLWERRSAHADFLSLRVGLGAVRWLPPLVGASVDAPPAGGRSAGLDGVLAAHGELADAPVGVDLGQGSVVGVVGERGPALALVRSLVCQAAVHHGPADLSIAVLTNREAAADWDWSKWLPHTRAPGGAGRLLAGDEEASAALVQSLLSAGPERVGPTVLAVLDDEALTEGRRAPARLVLRGDGGPVAGVVLASTIDRLPAICTIVVELRGPDGEAVVHRPQAGDRLERVLVAGCANDTARRCARSLARFEDPELDLVGAGLPDRVRLLGLLGLDGGDDVHALSSRLAARWAEAGADPALRTPIGVTEDDVYTVDLGVDGPHGLIAGTTGAGKSELLRTLVAGLAAGVSPEHLTFVLIDFKGGSAFDACARLPHTVGMVTDLDEHLAERALRCLEAELRHREQMLRAHGATDVAEHRRKGGPALPRLVVLIDEFATLKAELPGFVDALVGVAQRGRSLGVHLVLATQRPAGAVSDSIRANTNLRIALRVQDAGDSNDVIGTGAAATLPRDRAGRAFVRLGPSDLTLVQAALCTGPVQLGVPAPVGLSPFAFGPDPSSDDDAAFASADEETSELELLVEAARLAFAASGAPSPRRPWPDPLPAAVDLDSLDGDGAPFALADDPDRQRQERHGWRLCDGNLLLIGIGGSGTTTALGSIALALARRWPPDRLHLYVLSHGAGELAPLARLPHTGAVVDASERERQARLVRHLRAELDRRRSLEAEARARQPKLVLLLDGYAGFAAEFGDAAGMAVVDDLVRVLADGPDVDIHAAIAADRVGAVPMAVAALIRQRLVFRLAEPHDAAVAGIPGHVTATMVPGRAVDVETGRLVQIARPRAPLADAVVAITASWPLNAADGAPAPIGVLSRRVGVDEVAPAVRIDARPWFLPIGIGERALAPAGLVLYEGEHALIAGPARSGRTTALRALATVVARAMPDALVVAVAGVRSSLRAGEGIDSVHHPEALTDALDAVVTHEGPALLVIDDAEQVEDRNGALTAFLEHPPAHAHVIAAARTEVIRTAYQHWTRTLRRSKVGLLLSPNADLDGELLGQVLPRRAPVGLGPGRGWLVNGSELEVVQLVNSGLDDA